MSSVAKLCSCVQSQDACFCIPRRLTTASKRSSLPASKTERHAVLRTRVHTPLRSDLQTANLTETREHGFMDNTSKTENTLLTKSELLEIENELSHGEGIKALADFNNALRQLTSADWETKLQAVFREWCFNLESFNPAFAAVLLQVQLSIGESDYYHRDNCLRCLIQPLAGEYGMHNNEPQAKTHRQLFKDFYESIYPGSSLSSLFKPEPVHAKSLFKKMIHDIQSHGSDPVERASYALGYNLAIEFLADYEKRWMLQSFQKLLSEVVQHPIDWVFLEIHAEEIGHEAVLNFVPRTHLSLLKKAMTDHDRDFALFYRQLTSLLQD